jgi:hypothetical protein
MTLPRSVQVPVHVRTVLLLEAEKRRVWPQKHRQDLSSKPIKCQLFKVLTTLICSIQIPGSLHSSAKDHSGLTGLNLHFP